MITHQYKWPPNNLYVYPMNLKYGLDSLWYSESIGVDLNVYVNVGTVDSF